MNRRTRICSPLHNHSAIPPEFPEIARPERAGAGNETRTRDLNLGKVALYQLSYPRASQFHEPVILFDKRASWFPTRELSPISARRGQGFAHEKTTLFLTVPCANLGPRPQGSSHVPPPRYRPYRRRRRHNGNVADPFLPPPSGRAHACRPDRISNLLSHAKMPMIPLLWYIPHTEQH